jgi:DNA-binding NtrC family response regulator
MATERLPNSVTFRGGRIEAADGTSIEVGEVPIFIGRDSHCALVLPSRAVSAVHCELRATREGVLLRDLDSSNGTFLAGARLREALLIDPCTLMIADQRVRFVPSPAARHALPPRDRFGPLVGISTPMRALFRLLMEVAPTDLTVLVTGETGSGKELVAQALHEASPRSRKPFVVVDCTAVPASLAESLLFGHEKGSFTGAHVRTDGAFREADGGTLFLDELGELPAEVQAKLLRVLAERKVRRLGQTGYDPIDVRVIAATRRDLGREMNGGNFRTDLFFRLAQVRLELPPLRQRLDDLPLLIEAILDRNGRLDRTEHVKHFFAARLQGYDWPGNVRELVNAVSVAAALPTTIDDDQLAALLPLESRLQSERAAGSTSPFAAARRRSLEAFERAYFEDLVAVAGDNVSEMSRRSGLGRFHVRTYLRKYGLRGE